MRFARPVALKLAAKNAIASTEFTTAKDRLGRVIASTHINIQCGHDGDSLVDPAERHAVTRPKKDPERGEQRRRNRETVQFQWRAKLR